MDPNGDATVADAALKRVSVPQYSTDATKHDEYLERLRAHLHLIPETALGFKHDIVLNGIPRQPKPPMPAPLLPGQSTGR